ncbi:Gp49 family protein [Proteiniborus sp.]|uniref:Gp49 family protein n=1 Tax=Proteiniborus sp. TaxID=2079015 RepID=UPI003324B6F4
MIKINITSVEAVIEEKPPIEGWRCFKDTGDKIATLKFDLKEFVINEYNQAEKTVHVDYNNTIILSIMLKNGFIIVEHCICMDPKEFDMHKGIEICKERILNRLFELYHPVEIKNPENLKKLSIKAQ